VKFFYDSDETGRKKSMEKINQGYEVFLWTKFINENQLPFRKKWDLNDCLLYFHQNNIKTPDFEQYFSKDPLDMIDI
jgi:hypothetical protein